MTELIHESMVRSVLPGRMLHCFYLFAVLYRCVTSQL